jgi:hypothetical protein
MAKKEATGVKVRKAKNPDMEFQVESKWGMRYVKAVHKPTGLPISAPAHGLSVSSAAEWICLMDTALARVDFDDRDKAITAIQSVNECFTRKPSCPTALRKCVKKW